MPVFLLCVLAGCTPLPHYPRVVEGDGYLVECGKPYTPAEDLAGVKHDCAFYGIPQEKP